MTRRCFILVLASSVTLWHVPYTVLAALSLCVTSLCNCRFVSLFLWLMLCSNVLGYCITYLCKVGSSICATSWMYVKLFTHLFNLFHLCMFSSSIYLSLCMYVYLFTHLFFYTSAYLINCLLCEILEHFRTIKNLLRRFRCKSRDVFLMRAE